MLKSIVFKATENFYISIHFGSKFQLRAAATLSAGYVFKHSVIIVLRNLVVKPLTLRRISIQRKMSRDRLFTRAFF